MNKLANEVLRNQRYYLSDQVKSNDKRILYNFIPTILMDNSPEYLTPFLNGLTYQENPEYRFLIDIANLLHISKTVTAENKLEAKSKLIFEIKRAALEVNDLVEGTLYFNRYREIVYSLFEGIPDFENSLNYDALTKDRTTRMYHLSNIMNILKEDINNPDDGIEKFLKDTLLKYPSYIMGNHNLYITDISTGRTSGTVPHQFSMEDREYSLAEVFYICAYFLLFTNKVVLINACEDIQEIRSEIAQFKPIDISSALESFTVLQELTDDL